MHLTKIPLSSTGFFSKIVLDYINGSESLSLFYSHPPILSSFENVIREKQNENIDRLKLVEVLYRQYHNAGIHEADAQIQLFTLADTFCVVTAHQLNIFTGPLYVIYKTISTINACKLLKQNYPQHNFIPVFWLGSEDHDFAEINHFTVFNKILTWQDTSNGATGRINPASLETVLQEVKAILGESENAKKIYSIFHKAYTGSATLAQAARKYLHTLFGKEGLVVVDGDDFDFKHTCKDIILDEIINKSSNSIVTETNALLSEKYSIQANPRDINLFYLKENQRERIIYDAEKKIYTMLHTDISFTQEEVISEIKTHPEHFSPNVILRPLFQQKVLPALAYIGGGGEIAYWLQLKQLFAYHNISFPVLMLRNSALIIDKNTSPKMRKLKLSLQDIFLEEDALIKKYITENASATINLSEQKQELEKIFKSILSQAIQVDTSLENTVLAEKQNLLNSFQKLESKLLKAEKQKSEGAVQKIKGIKGKLFPQGNLQEREDNFMQFYVSSGNNFFSALYAGFNPFEQDFLLFEEGE